MQDRRDGEKMILIPEYLKSYAIEEKQRGDRLSFKLRCTCGCESFVLFENQYTDEEKRLIKEYEERVPDIGWHTLYGGIDGDGNLYHYIKIFGIIKKHIAIPKPPFFMDIHVVKAQCLQCQKDILLFDSRYYGYDGMMAEHQEERKYIPQLKQRGDGPFGIKIAVENDLSLEEFNENIGEQCSPEFYSNAFGHIRICGLKGDRKTILYDFETA